MPSFYSTNPAKTLSVIITISQKITWATISLFLVICLLCSAWYMNNSKLDNYVANDTKYRFLKLDSTKKVFQIYLLMIDSLYNANTEMRKTVLAQEDQNKLNFERLEQAALLKAQAKELEEKAKRNKQTCLIDCPRLFSIASYMKNLALFYQFRMEFSHFTASGEAKPNPERPAPVSKRLRHKHSPLEKFRSEEVVAKLQPLEQPFVPHGSSFAARQPLLPEIFTHPLFRFLLEIFPGCASWCLSGKMRWSGKLIFVLANRF